MNIIRERGAGAGTQTAALAFAGGPPGLSAFNSTESWNGTSWTTLGDLNQGREFLAGCGASNTAALAFGGDLPPNSALTESWNGTSWSETADLSTARRQLAGAGTNTLALASGGTPPATGATEEFNTGPQTITFSDS